MRRRLRVLLCWVATIMVCGLAVGRLTAAVSSRTYLLMLALGAPGPTATVPYGATVTLSPSFRFGSGVIKDGGNAVIVPSAVSGTGYPVGPLTSSQTYTLFVTNPAGDTVTGGVSVTVLQPSISQIAPSGLTLTTGHQTTYSASVSGAVDTVVIWSVDGIAGGNAAVGTISSGGVYTAGTTVGTHTIGATAEANGTANSTTAVTVVAAPTASITASTVSPLYGATDVSVTPVFANATSVSVGSYQGGNNISSAPASGVAIPVMGGGFTTTMTYWVRATNQAGDSIDASVVITPKAVTVGALATGSTQATVGAYVSYVVPAVTGAVNSSVTWWASGGTFSNIGSAAGSRVYWRAPMTAGTYSIHATAADNVTYSSATVTVVPHQTIASFSAADATVPYGGSTTLTGSWANGRGVIYPGGLLPSSGSPIGTGALTSSTSFTLYVDPTSPYSDLVPNGDGEDGNSTSGYPSALLVNDPANAHSGSWVRELVVPSGYVLQRAGDWTPANPGDPVRWCMWAKSSAAWSGNGVGLYIAWTDAAGNYLSGQYVSSGFVPTTTYQWYYVAGVVPAGAAGFYTTYEWSVSGGDVGKTLYVDDLWLSFEPTASTTVNVSTVSVAAGANFTGGYVTRGKTVTMSASVSGAANSNVSWSAGGGSFSVNPSASGANTIWTPPATNGAYNVWATSVADGSKNVQRTYTVVDPATASLVASTTAPTYGSVVTLTPTFSGGTAVLGTSQGASDISTNATSGATYKTAPVTGAIGFWLRVTNQAGDYVDSYSGTVTPQSVSVSPINPGNPSVTVGKTLTLSAQALGSSDLGVDWFVNGVAGGNSGVGTMSGANLAPNPSFDTVNSGRDTGADAWGIYNNTPTQEPATAARIASGGVDGGAFVRVSWSANNTSTKGVLTLGDWGPGNGVAGGWKPYTSYRVTWWARGSGSNLGGWMAMAWNAAPANTTRIKDQGLGATWQQWETVITTEGTPEGNGHLYIYLGSNSNGTLDIDKVSVREVGNYVPNSDFSAGVYLYWIVSNYTPGWNVSIGVNLNSSWQVSGLNTAWVHENNGPVATPNTYYDYVSQLVPVTQGVTYRSSVFTGAHRCTVLSYIFWYDSGGGWAGASYTSDPISANNQEASGGSDLNGYKWIRSEGMPPSNAAYARFAIRKLDTAAGQADSWMFLTLPKFEAIGGTGTYTAPTTPGTYTVKAVSDLAPSANAVTTVNVVAAPTASISASATNPLYGQTVSVTPTFVGSNAVVGTGDGTNFFGTSDISSNATSGAAINVGAATATKTYYLRAWNAAGDNADASVTVTPQTVSISPISGGGGYTSVAYSRAMNATVSGAANGNVNWSASGGSFSPTTTGSGANTTWYAPSTPGVYTIYATSAATGAQTSTTITVVALPTASLTASPASPLYGAASGVTASFTGAASEVLGSYQGGANWNGGPLSSGTYYQVTGSTTSSYTAWLRVTNAAGQYADASAPVSPQTVTIAKGNGVASGSINTGYSFSATVSGAANSTVTWSASGGSFSSTSTGSGVNTTWTAPSSAGSYTVTATTAATGATTSWPVTVSGGAGTVSSFTATLVSDAAVSLYDGCSGSNAGNAYPTRDSVTVTGAFTSAELSRWNGSSYVVMATTSATNTCTWNWSVTADQGSCISPEFIDQAVYGKGTVWRVRTYGSGGWSSYVNVTEN